MTADTAGNGHRERTTPAAPAGDEPPTARRWNRGDGQPLTELMDEAVDRILETCTPAEIVLCGAAAQADLHDESDIELLIVLDEGTDPDGNVRGQLKRTLRELPRTEVMTATTTQMTDGAESATRIHRTAASEGVALYRRGRRLPYLPRKRPAPDNAGNADGERASRP